MGKLNYEPHIKHFSHEHPMELINIPSPQQPPQNITKAKTCSGCKERASPGQWIYTCKSCNFNLHIPCSQMPKVINHPSDPNHPLVLLPSPAYPCGSFNCDGCGRQKNTGFSYHCTACSLDLHILCAAKPLSVNHHAHLAHPLTLTFYPPYQINGFSCDICHKLGMNHWLYRCASCGFDAHIGCADNPNNQRAVAQQPQPQTLLQHHYSFPGATHQLQVMPQGAVHQGIPVINNNLVQPPQQHRLYHANSSPNMGVAQQMMMSTQQTYSQQQQMQQQMQQQLQQMQLQPLQQQLQQQMQQQLQQMQLQPQQQQLQQQMQQQLQQMQLQPQQQLQQGYDLNPQLSQQLQLQQQQLQQLQQLQQQQQQQNTNDVMNMAAQGMIEGASQQLGQSLMENAIGGGNNDGGGGGGGGGGDSSSSLLDIGSQILGLMLN